MSVCIAVVCGFSNFMTYSFWFTASFGAVNQKHSLFVSSFFMPQARGFCGHLKGSSYTHLTCIKRSNCSRFSRCEYCLSWSESLWDQFECRRQYRCVADMGKKEIKPKKKSGFSSRSSTQIERGSLLASGQVEPLGGKTVCGHEADDIISSRSSDMSSEGMQRPKGSTPGQGTQGSSGAKDVKNIPTPQCPTSSDGKYEVLVSAVDPEGSPLGPDLPQDDLPLESSAMGKSRRDSRSQSRGERSILSDQSDPSTKSRYAHARTEHSRSDRVEHRTETPSGTVGTEQTAHVQTESSDPVRTSYLLGLGMIVKIVPSTRLMIKTKHHVRFAPSTERTKPPDGLVRTEHNVQDQAERSDGSEHPDHDH